MNHESWIMNHESWIMIDQWWMINDEWIKEDEDEEEWGEYREKLKDYSVLKIESVRLVDSIDTEVES